MQGAEMEDEGSVLKYMTKSEIEEQRSSLLIMTQRLFRTVRNTVRPMVFLFSRPILPFYNKGKKRS